MSGEHATGVNVQLSQRERDVLAVLVEQRGRVIDREGLRLHAGLKDLNVRRCESALVGVRRALGNDAVVTVRRRGWRLSPDALAVALTIISSLG